MDLGLKGKVVVVTGASRGIGKETCVLFAKEGANLACVDVNADGVQAVAEELCAAWDVKAMPYVADVSDFAATQDLGTAITEEFGKVDVLVNNAGVTKDGVFLRMSEADWDRVMDVNLKGAFNVTRAFARGILKNRGARVINMASLVGIRGNAGQANYAASKGGLIALTRSLAKEFGTRGVTVNAIAPGFIDTDMTGEVAEAHQEAMVGAISLARPGTPQDVANGVLYLASEMASYITGQVLVIDGGMRL
jgi:3-oxoacyl-[acyl-carrier protein] reductase